VTITALGLSRDLWHTGLACLAALVLKIARSRGDRHDARLAWHSGLQTLAALVAVSRLVAQCALHA